jgi:hypothetical protein
MLPVFHCGLHIKGLFVYLKRYNVLYMVDMKPALERSSFPRGPASHSPHCTVNQRLAQVLLPALLPCRPRRLPYQPRLG